MHNCVTAYSCATRYSTLLARNLRRLPVATLVLGHDRRNKKAGIDGASACTSHRRASDRTSTGYLRDRSSFTSFTRRDQRTGRKRSERNTRADGRRTSRLAPPLRLGFALVSQPRRGHRSPRPSPVQLRRRRQDGLQRAGGDGPAPYSLGIRHARGGRPAAGDVATRHRRRRDVGG